MLRRYFTPGLCGCRPHHYPASQHPGAESGHGTRPGAISDTCFSARWHLCSVVLVSGRGESITTSPAGHHLSMSKNFPVMPSGWAAVMVQTTKTVGIFSCWVYMGSGYYPNLDVSEIWWSKLTFNYVPGMDGTSTALSSCLLCQTTCLSYPETVFSVLLGRKDERMNEA